MKLIEITNKNDQELVALVDQLQHQIADAAIDLRTKKVTNVKATHALKLSLARALTIQTERQIARKEQA